MIRIVAIFFCFTLYALAEDSADTASPDGQVTAFVRSVGSESIVAFRDTISKSFCSKGFLSGDGEHGLYFLTGKWTPDSQYFVFTMSSSGGHSSWHARTYVYRRKQNDILMFDAKYIRPVVNPDFKVSAPSFLTIEIMDDSLAEPTEGKWITIDMNSTLKKAE